MLYTPEHAPRPLTDEDEAQVHEYAMRICEEIGLDVLHQDARKLLEEAGQKVDGDRVYFDRGFVMEQLAKAKGLMGGEVVFGIIDRDDTYRLRLAYGSAFKTK